MFSWRHESTLCCRLRNCGSRAARRDSTIQRITLRSPLAWCALGCSRLNLPGSRWFAGRCSPLGRILGAAFRRGGVGGSAGRRTPWSATSAEPEAIGAGRCRSSEDAERGRHGRQFMGRQDLGRLDRTTVWSALGSTPVPETISTIGIPFAQAASAGGAGEPGTTEGA